MAMLELDGRLALQQQATLLVDLLVVRLGLHKDDRNSCQDSHK